jgi:hypothetical protein
MHINNFENNNSTTIDCLKNLNNLNLEEEQMSQTSEKSHKITLQNSEASNFSLHNNQIIDVLESTDSKSTKNKNIIKISTPINGQNFLKNQIIIKQDEFVDSHNEKEKNEQNQVIGEDIGKNHRSIYNKKKLLREQFLNEAMRKNLTRRRNKN